MKKIIFVGFILGFFSCSTTTEEEKITSDSVSNSASANGKSNKNLPEIKFKEAIFDFGLITQGEKVNHAFAFKNIGTKNLIITGASGSCGCTIPEWPKQPILPGGEGKINVVFSSEGKSGIQEKTITIVTNCEPATRIIKIKTEVIVIKTAK